MTDRFRKYLNLKCCGYLSAFSAFSAPSRLCVGFYTGNQRGLILQNSIQCIPVHYRHVATAGITNDMFQFAVIYEGTVMP